MHRPPLRAAFLACCWIAQAALAAPPSPAGKPAERALIPIQAFFGKASAVKHSPRLSPDGTHIAYLAPAAPGQPAAIWLRSAAKSDDAKLGDVRQGNLRRITWAEDGRHLLFMADLAGETNHLLSLDLQSKVIRDLTPFVGIKAFDFSVRRRVPGQVLVSLNLRQRSKIDLYRVDLASGALTLEAEDPGGALGYAVDTELRGVATLTMSPVDSSTAMLVRDQPGAPWRQLMAWPPAESGQPEGWSADGKALYVKSTLEADTARLQKIDAATGKVLEILASNPKCDVGSTVLHPVTGQPQAAEFYYSTKEWMILDPALRDDFAALTKLARGEIELVSRDRADQTWIVAYGAEAGAMSWYLYDRRTRKGERLFDNQTSLGAYPLAQTQPVVVPARDGLQLPGYLTLPIGVPAKNLPMVLYVHGGPWSRDSWGDEQTPQWLADRGYAVLQVNFRGSTGFGKRHLSAGFAQLGVGAMQHDLSDAVAWAVRSGLADPKRVGIMGMSYGGYATLAGLVFTPDLYACGVDFFGMSNLGDNVRALPSYWESTRSMWVARVGDVEHDEALNRRVSPVFHAAQAKAPVLVIQGGEDVRVKPEQSEKMVAALRAHSKAATYLYYPNEGHGFRDEANLLDVYGRLEQFLARHLGGRAEPLRKVAGATVQER